MEVVAPSTGERKTEHYQSLILQDKDGEEWYMLVLLYCVSAHTKTHQCKIFNIVSSNNRFPQLVIEWYTYCTYCVSAQKRHHQCNIFNIALPKMQYHISTYVYQIFSLAIDRSTILHSHVMSSVCHKALRFSKTALSAIFLD